MCSPAAAEPYSTTVVSSSPYALSSCATRSSRVIVAMSLPARASSTTAEPAATTETTEPAEPASSPAPAPTATTPPTARAAAHRNEDGHASAAAAPAAPSAAATPERLHHE